MGTSRLTESSIAKLQPPEGEPRLYEWDTEQRGFGVVVGQTQKTFVVRGRTNGVQRKVTIGIAGHPRADGHLWTVLLARKRARELLAEMAGGKDPTAEKVLARAPGPTLRAGMEAHLERMRKKRRADRTITTFENEVNKYLEDHLDEPINDIDCAALHDSIKSNATARAGSNPNNPKGAPLANRVIAHVSACWNSLNKKLKGQLGHWNPAKTADRDVLKPKRERIAEGVMADWYTRVQTMRNPVQRDGLVLALFTGLRSEDVRSVRWEHVDLNARTLTLPDPKGGEARAFLIPLGPTSVEILERRQRENAANKLLPAGDGGFAFPAIGVSGDVGPIGDLRQQMHDGDKHTRFPAEDVHTLRRTFESVAHELGVTELDLHVLTNHSYGSQNVNATYIAQHIDHLAKCTTTIDAGMRKRLGLPATSKRKAPKPKAKPAARHLHSVGMSEG